MKNAGEMSMSRHVVVISEDAMVFEDVEKLKKLPGFASVWDQTARVNRVKSIYPTITYPCHTTMMTGCYPDKHGITNNELPVVGETSSLWVHKREAVKVPTVFDYAHQAGLTTAASSWPVTGSDPSIDYLLDEIWPELPGETAPDCYRRNGTSEEIIREFVMPNLPALIHREHPWHDMFFVNCALGMLGKYKPNLLMVHPAIIDHARHASGVFGGEVDQSLGLTDAWLSQFIAVAKNAGIYDDTDFFIISDHGQMNISRVVALNVFLADAGFITTDAEGNFVDYRAFCKAAGQSAHVYLKDPSDRETEKAVYELLQDLCAKEVYGISRVFTREEVKAEQHLDGGFSFVLESDGYTGFSNKWTRPVLKPFSNDYKEGRATHGYLPEKGPQPTLIAWGPDIKPGAVLEDARLIDEAPTIAHALGLEMKNVDGRVLTELFR